MAGTRIFISHHHSHEEDAFTAHLVADLEAAGADVWVDDKGITSDDFVQKISEGLAGRQWLVLVMTPAALASPWVRREVNVALSEHTAGRMLGVLPIAMAPCAVDEIPMLWRTLRRYDATQDYTAARDSLLSALGLLRPQEKPPQAPAPQHAPDASSIRVAPPTPPPSVPPAAQSTPSGAPPRLVSLGYMACAIKGTEVLLPPLCAVPAGEFLLGSKRRQDRHAHSDELPQQRLTLPAFQLAKFPVTVAEYACFVRAGQKQPTDWQNQLIKLDHPVVSVSWHDAVAYAAWLAKTTGQPWRLPSEAEWEKAARWDGRVARIYPWGDAFDESRCNTRASGIGATTPVGSYPNGASSCGVQDMTGNVWEWTSSLFKPYPYTSTDGREDLDSTGNRVPRGDSWNNLAMYARAACRFGMKPDDFGDNIGVRLVLAAAGS